MRARTLASSSAYGEPAWSARTVRLSFRAASSTPTTSKSSSMPETSIYVAGGTLQAGGGLYLARRADEELRALCREGTFAYVLTARQLGKSSLMVRTAERLAEEGVRSVTI